MQSGETFVLKIPSKKGMGVTRVMAPNLPHDIIVIRPGEKLHEVMITEDPSRSCYDTGSRYVILPSGQPNAADHHRQAGPVGPGFRNAFNTNASSIGPNGPRHVVATVELGRV
jgi:UDP-N-acetylglucosamine 4,6-dehydratase/5-epimerase